MGYLELVRGNLLNVPAGHLLVGRGAEATRVAIPAFELADAALTVKQLRAFHAEYASQPYARFEQAPNGYLKMTHMGPSEEALKNLPVAVVPAGEPIPLNRIIKVVPTEEEYEARFKNRKVGIRKLLLKDDHPAVYIDYFEAAACAASVSCRLPTQEEREYAARAGREGDDICGVGGDGKLRADNAHWSELYNSRNKKKATAKVKSFDPTPWGHYDLAGNSYDWVALKGALYQGYSGGAWFYGIPDDLLAACCHQGRPDGRALNVGARLARSVLQDASL